MSADQVPDLEQLGYTFKGRLLTDPIDTAPSATDLLRLAQASLGPSLTAFELMCDTCLRLVDKHMPGSRLPLGERAPWYALLECSDTRGDDQAAQTIEALLGTTLDDEIITYAVVSQSLSQRQALWALRENISEAQGAEGKTIKHDIALPISAIPAFVTGTGDRLARDFPGLRLVVFGHLGDGNLHYNLSPPEGNRDPSDFTAKESAINRLVHDAVNHYGGSISAEHGLGVLRRDESARYKSPVELALMQTIKSALDPLNLMNPGKVLP